ncbi:tetratricopeptide repeat protein [Oleomonas cavernae]|uniref:Tetratricopeptide repeat protein 38 n=1 Tax=Oleomonas cavernae TaxID=2320859 RepID=A0A418WDR5_9PROT|nr:tetratricopeptide repeat protein [Oleomonas cavernae]RJF88165.1 tetratricopeptide repeat protein [Oleomonas cavernae]
MTANKFDCRGNPVSNATQAAVEGLDRAIDKLRLYQADPLFEVDAVLADHPDLAMGHAFRAGLLATTADKAFEPELAKSVAAAEALMPGANERERGHIQAVGAWLSGDVEAATEHWGRTAMAYPRDLTAVQLAQVTDFFLGYSTMLRDRVARVLPHWDTSVPGYGSILGMHAFGLEEAGDYAQAEAAGRECVERDPRDAWGVHAVAHVMEMQGRAHEGIDWLAGTAAAWTGPAGLFSYHNWWHKALFHLDLGETQAALTLFDEQISAGGFGQALELVDGAALLWRIAALGHDVGNRWTLVHDNWAARADDGFYAFNDMHVMMAAAATGDDAMAHRVVAAVRRAAAGSGTNAMMSREVGLPAVLGLAAFGLGEYAAALDLLLPLRGKANRFGGSHAQRDVIAWTATEAAVRLGDRALADALIAERLAAKPQSPLNRLWQSRASGLAVAA